VFTIEAPKRWINISYANIATTSPAAHRAAAEWADALARGGAAEFDGDAEQSALLPLRRATSRLLSCGVGDICVGSSATALMSSIAWAIAPGEGSNVVSTQASFPSTVYPWSRASESFGAEVRLAAHDDDMYTDPSSVMALIDEQTAVIVLSHVEYSNGQRYNLEAFSKVAREVDALLITDATQSMGMVPIDAPNFGVDAMVASGYKWLRGSFGAAVGYISPRLRELNPGLVGFRSHVDMWNMRPDRVDLPQDASRFEYTTLHFGAALGLAEAVNELDNFGIDEVWEHDLGLADLIISGAKELGFDIASPTNEAERSAIVSLRPPEGVDSDAVVFDLQEIHGIIVSSRSGLIRVSPHIDNVPGDIARLISALGSMLP